MNDRQRVTIDLGAGRAYEILIGTRLLDEDASFKALKANQQAIIVSNPTVSTLYASKLRTRLEKQFRSVELIEIPDGEQYKSWESLDKIFDSLLRLHSNRKTILFALGGGVVGDITGFAAACYMRGIDFVQVPTTLLAQVDSSVGGKTAVNHPRGKNMIGAFHQPLRVVADLDTLDTLPNREIAAGLAEIIKYGPIADDDFLSWIESNIDALWALDKKALAHAVTRSCEIKARVVAADERESGLRAILNFGHTFGHAIEAGMGYGSWLHGEAVGCGMVMAIDLSARLGLVPRSYADRLTLVIERAHLPIHGPSEVSPDRYLDLMRVDKKAEAGQILFVLIEAPGRAIVRSASDDMVRDVIIANTR